MHNVFVYGTLKRGFPNFADGMSDARYVGRYRTVERFPLVVGGPWFSPCLIDERGTGHRVAGELFRVDDDRLALLDALESVHLSDGYRRREIAVAAASGGDARQAWVYLRDRRTIDGIHSAPMADYPLDPRYVAPDDSRRSAPAE